MINNMHIEKCKPEDISNAILDAANDSLLTNALAKEYAEASGVSVSKVEPAESSIEELPSALSVFLNRIFKTPASLFQGKSMSQMFSGIKEAYDWLKERIKGSEFVPAKTLTEPLDASQLVNNLKTLADRKITNAAKDDGLPDGISLARILCDSSVFPTELIDDNVGWVMDKALSGCPKLKKLIIYGSGTMSLNWFTGMPYLDELVVPNISAYYCKTAGSDIATMPAGVSNLANLKKLDLRGLGDANVNGNGNQYGAVIAGCPSLKEVWLGRVNGINTHASWGETKHYIQYCPNLEKLSVETMSERNCLVRSGQNEFLLHLEIRGTQNESCNLNWWNPTDKGSVFLSNFQQYIADRVADMTGQPAWTLTLSAEVYAALEAQEGQTILATLANKNWNVAQA